MREKGKERRERERAKKIKKDIESKYKDNLF